MRRRVSVAASLVLSARLDSSVSGHQPIMEAKAGSDLVDCGGSVVPKSTFLDSNHIVIQYAKEALQREGRDKVPEAILITEETTHYPIFTGERRTIRMYDYMIDISSHVTPLYHPLPFHQPPFWFDNPGNKKEKKEGYSKL